MVWYFACGSFLVIISCRYGHASSLKHSGQVSLTERGMHDEDEVVASKRAVPVLLLCEVKFFHQLRHRHHHAVTCKVRRHIQRTQHMLTQTGERLFAHR